MRGEGAGETRWSRWYRATLRLLPAPSEESDSSARALRLLRLLLPPSEESDCSAREESPEDEGEGLLRFLFLCFLSFFCCSFSSGESDS